ncbi:unnamed protein product [Schistosoma turkestanicum]|nr:unnamed protein product [Schistosoma turkestanicum]
MMIKKNFCSFFSLFAQKNRFINARRRIVQPMIDQSNRAGPHGYPPDAAGCLPYMDNQHFAAYGRPGFHPSSLRPEEFYAAAAAAAVGNNVSVGDLDCHLPSGGRSNLPGGGGGGVGGYMSNYPDSDFPNSNNYQRSNSVGGGLFPNPGNATAAGGGGGAGAGGPYPPLLAGGHLPYTPYSAPSPTPSSNTPNNNLPGRHSSQFPGQFGLFQNSNNISDNNINNNNSNYSTNESKLRTSADVDSMQKATLAVAQYAAALALQQQQQQNLKRNYPITTTTTNLSNNSSLSISTTDYHSSNYRGMTNGHSTTTSATSTTTPLSPIHNDNSLLNGSINPMNNIPPAHLQHTTADSPTSSSSPSFPISNRHANLNLSNYNHHVTGHHHHHHQQLHHHSQQQQHHPHQQHHTAGGFLPSVGGQDTLTQPSLQDIHAG